MINIIIKYLLPFISGMLIAIGLHCDNIYIQTISMILGIYGCIFSIKLGEVL